MQRRPIRSARPEGRSARMARPRRHGPGADGHIRPALHLDETPGMGKRLWPPDRTRVQRVAIDYGIKRNILRLLAGVGCKVTVVPATTSAEDILAMKPDGVFLSNGPGGRGDGQIPVPVIQKVINSGTPTLALPGSDAGPRGRRQTRKMIRAITAPILRSRTRPPARWKSPMNHVSRISDPA